MAADTWLQQDKVIGIARGERQIIDFLVADGAANADPIGFDQGSASRDLHRRGDGSNLERAVDGGLRSRVQNHSRMGFRFESSLEYGDSVSSERQVRKDVISVLVRVFGTGVAGLLVRDTNLRLRDGIAGWIGNPAAKTAVYSLRLREQLRNHQQKKKAAAKGCEYETVQCI